MSDGDQAERGVRGEGEAARWILAHDWSATPLGPIARWPAALKTVVEVILGSNRPMFVVWGPQHTLIYNQAYAGVLANKHPALGRDFLAVWDELRGDLEPLVARAYRGEPTSMPEIPLVMQRKGYREPTWWDFAYTPIRDATGQVGGFLCACNEVTDQVVGLRDRAFRLALEDRLRSMGDPDEMMVAAVEMLRTHLGASRIAYAEDAGDEEHVTVTMDSNDQVPSIKGTYRLGDYGEQMLAEMRAGRAIVRHSIADDPELTPAEKAAHAGLNIGATANIPVVRAERLVALIAVHYTAAHHYPDTEVQLAREVAARIWSAVERLRAELRLRELNQVLEVRERAAASQLKMLDLAFEAADMGAWDYDLVADVCHFDPRARALYGLPRDVADHGPQSVAKVVHPDDIPAVLEEARRASDPAGEGRYQIDYRVIGPDGGRAAEADRTSARTSDRTSDRTSEWASGVDWRWMRVWGRTEFVGEGAARRAVRIVGASRDITARREAERHRELLIDELNHRVKNTLAIVQSIAAQTARNTRDPDRFTTVFTDRVVALSRAHNLLAETYWGAPRLAEIVETALAPFATDDHRVVWEGPEARVEPSPAVALSLVLHELATNAAKYGALSDAAGRVELTWRAVDGRGVDGRAEDGRAVDGRAGDGRAANEHLVELTWREHGGPPVTPPTRRGFGSRLITAAGQQLGGAVDLAFDPAGVTCRLSLAVRSAALPDAGPGSGT